MEFGAEQNELGADMGDVGEGSCFAVGDVERPEGPAMEAKRNLEAMRQQTGGDVAARWTARGLLLCLSFAQSLKAGSCR